MPDRTVCAACRKSYWGFEGFAKEESSQWLCPALRRTSDKWAIGEAAEPPKGCFKFMEQGIAVARSKNA